MKATNPKVRYTISVRDVKLQVILEAHLDLGGILMMSN